MSGPALKLSSIHQPAYLYIEPKATEVGDVIITVLSPSDHKVPVKILGSKTEKLTAEFQPFEVGPHSVAVTLDHEALPGSPFTCNVYDVKKVAVTGLDPTKVFHFYLSSIFSYHLLFFIPFQCSSFSATFHSVFCIWLKL